MEFEHSIIPNMKAKRYDISTFIQLAEAIQNLSLAKSQEEIFALVSKSAQQITGAQGAAFVLRDIDEQCYYSDEASISPLWKGQRFPIRNCISGWAMLNKQVVIVPDIYQDPRIPLEAYVSTYIKSLVIIPIRREDPIAAIGVYWSQSHVATNEEVELLEALANCTATALENISLLSEVKESNHSLRNLLRARDEFLSIASHQLKTPLTALQIQIQMIQRKIRQDQKGHAGTYLKEIQSSLKHISNLNDVINELLDASLITLGELKLNPGQFSLNSIVSEAITKLMPALRAAQCELDVNFDDELNVFMDSYRVEQIFSHLISNIPKHAPGSRALLFIQKKNDKLIIELEDDGPGIPQELQYKIFRRFEREGLYTQKPGLGLGLYITKKLVELHGGYLFLYSSPESGTKYVIELPMNEHLLKNS